MIALVFVALIVPLTLVILSFRQYSAPPKSAVPETQGLRAALEQAADKTWQQPPPMSDGRSVFLFNAQGSEEEARKALEQAARKLNGVALPIAAGPRGEERVLVTIPSASSQGFESGALRNFTLSVQGNPTGERQLYEIVFPLP
ncbi:MAG: hypothetical protein WCO94_03210 [Verrucomicrobiota bacterium]